MTKCRLIFFILFIAVLSSTVGCMKSNKDIKTDNRSIDIGLVTNNPNGQKNIQGFKDEMENLGYIGGKNVHYIYKGVPTSGVHLEAVLKKMVMEEVDLIFTAGTPTGVAAHRITAGTDIPVVFGVIADPISAGVMSDLTLPGGNMTGVKIRQNQARRLELLLDIAPDTERIFVPFNPNDPAPMNALEQIKDIAPKLGIEIIEGHAHNSAEATALIHSIPEDIDAIFMLPDSTVNAHLALLVDVALERKLPVSGPSMVQVEGGVLIAFGIIHHKAGSQAAHIADQILNGANPGELPVETAEVFLGINLQTAELIGLDIPHDVIQQAEIIIRGDN